MSFRLKSPFNHSRTHKDKDKHSCLCVAWEALTMCKVFRTDTTFVDMVYMHPQSSAINIQNNMISSFSLFSVYLYCQYLFLIIKWFSKMSKKYFWLSCDSPGWQLNTLRVKKKEKRHFLFRLPWSGWVWSYTDIFQVLKQ